ncbi:MAG: carbon monoxide dehydrogenase, partial [Firmicutes bacterium]|nr:carbon monoxide dehydrogenase [Bacillota bacterium]
LGRGTARAVDAFIVVVEPGRRSFQTARAVAKLAADLGIKKVYAVANKVRLGEEEAIREGIEGLPILGFMPYDPSAVSADLSGQAAYESSTVLLEAAARIKEKLDQLLG